MRIIITLEIEDDTPAVDADELAKAVLSDIEDYDPENFTAGDLREYVKAYGYKIERPEPEPEKNNPNYHEMMDYY